MAKVLINQAYDAGLAYYSNTDFQESSNFVGLDSSFVIQTTTSTNVEIESLLTIPIGARYAVLFSRSSSTLSFTAIFILFRSNFLILFQSNFYSFS